MHRSKLISRDSQKICSENIKSYKKMGLIGRGAFGHVFKAEHIISKNIVAIKKLNKKDKNHDGISQSFIREISIFGRLKHPNIVRFLSASVQENSEYGFIVMEYMPTDLQKQLIKVGKGREGYGFRICETKNIGVSYCHSCSIFHRDIKPANILMTSQTGTVKIADFGISKQLLYNPHPNTSPVSSLFYRAPEVILANRCYGKEIDIWAIGCIFAECLLGRKLFSNRDLTEYGQICGILKAVIEPSENLKPLYSYNIQQLREMRTKLEAQPQKSLQPEFENLLNMEKQNNNSELGLAIDLINKMLQLNPEKRITAKQALNHPFLQAETQQKIQQVCEKKLKSIESARTLFGGQFQQQ